MTAAPNGHGPAANVTASAGVIKMRRSADARIPPDDVAACSGPSRELLRGVLSTEVVCDSGVDVLGVVM